jgi:hypothetical protein
MRSLLNLPPAPEYQQRLVPPAGSASMPAFVAPAASRDEVIPDILNG